MSERIDSVDSFFPPIQSRSGSRGNSAKPSSKPSIHTPAPSLSSYKAQKEKPGSSGVSSKLQISEAAERELQLEKDDLADLQAMLAVPPPAASDQHALDASDDHLVAEGLEALKQRAAKGRSTPQAPTAAATTTAKKKVDPLAIDIPPVHTVPPPSATGGRSSNRKFMQDMRSKHLRYLQEDISSLSIKLHGEVDARVRLQDQYLRTEEELVVTKKKLNVVTTELEGKTELVHRLQFQIKTLKGKVPPSQLEPKEQNHQPAENQPSSPPRITDDDFRRIRDEVRRNGDVTSHTLDKLIPTSDRGMPKYGQKAYSVSPAKGRKSISKALTPPPPHTRVNRSSSEGNGLTRIPSEHLSLGQWEIPVSPTPDEIVQTARSIQSPQTPPAPSETVSLFLTEQCDEQLEEIFSTPTEKKDDDHTREDQKSENLVFDETAPSPVDEALPSGGPSMSIDDGSQPKSKQDQQQQPPPPPPVVAPPEPLSQPESSKDSPTNKEPASPASEQPTTPSPTHQDSTALKLPPGMEPSSLSSPVPVPEPPTTQPQSTNKKDDKESGAKKVREQPPRGSGAAAVAAHRKAVSNQDSKQPRGVKSKPPGMTAKPAKNTFG